MHGLVLVELHKYLVAELGADLWSQLPAAASIEPKVYEHVESYPDEEALALLDAASRLSGMARRDLLLGFGESIAPSLMHLYKVLIQPEWKTLELIEHVERTIHQVVRFRNPDARPPEIHCKRRASDEILISYTSPRRLCALVEGIARGVAKFYGEEIDVRDTSCISRGDPECLIAIKELGRTSTAPDTPTGWVGARPVDSNAATLFDASTIDTPAIDSNAATVYETETSVDPSSSSAKPGAERTALGEIDTIEALPGERIGRYELLSEIGRGAMGVVYRAHDPVLERIVAIKILLGHRGTESVARFNQEARSVARLRHAGIVPIFDLGEHRDRPYFVMELLEGVTFKQWRFDKSTSQLVRVLATVTSALDFAHQQGIVHRDVKCENIMMSENDRPVLMDFGVARDVAASDPLEEVGVVIGTPSFMSPEQFEGLPGLIGPQTDVYAIGAVLYYCLCGGPVFSADSQAALFRKVLLETPVPPRARNPEIDPGLEAVIMRCLEKRSEDRYPSAAALARELGPYWENESAS